MNQQHNNLPTRIRASPPIRALTRITIPIARTTRAKLVRATKAVRTTMTSANRISTAVRSAELYGEEVTPPFLYKLERKSPALGWAFWTVSDCAGL